MSGEGPDQRGAIGFAEKVLELLDEGRYTATYKFAVLLALMDLSLESTEAALLAEPCPTCYVRACGLVDSARHQPIDLEG